jgi:hypothetical protein
MTKTRTTPANLTEALKAIEKVRKEADREISSLYRHMAKPSPVAKADSRQGEGAREDAARLAELVCAAS